MIENYMEKIHAYIDDNRNDMIKDWEILVRMEDHFEEVKNVQKVCAWIKEKFEEMGFECHVEDVGDGWAGTLVGIWGKDRPGKPVIFSGHMDTVQKSGSFGDNPFLVKEGNVYGPGVLDMKGGIIIAMYVIKALQEIGFDERPIKIIFSGDEEYNHITTTGAEVFKREAKGALCAFNMESGNLNNALTVQRKTSNTVHMKVIGVGGHAGNNFLIGKNAINEAAYKILEMLELTDLETGTYMNTSIIKGGSGSCAIPELCEVVFNIRLASGDESERVCREVERIMGKSQIEGTKIEYTIDKSQLPAYQKTESIEHLLNFVNDVATENGFEPFGGIAVGGASDAGNIIAVGTPVLCACGVRGQYHHSANEFAVIESLYERTKIFAAVVCNLSKFE